VEKKEEPENAETEATTDCGEGPICGKLETACLFIFLQVVAKND